MKITGRLIETIGLIFSIASGAILLNQVESIGLFVCIGVYLLTRFFPKLFSFLKFFAEVPAWPAYVSLILAGMFAAYHGGWKSIIVLIGLGILGDGRMFDSLY